MTALHALECPSCGANLSYAGGPETTITCDYCGKIIEVPSELRAPVVSSAAAITAAVYARLRVGNRVGAVKVYMELTNASLEDAQTAIESMIRRGLDSAGPLPPPDISSLDLADRAAVRAKIRELSRAGFRQMAVDIYMRVYQVEAKEAYKAVEVIEQGR